MARRPLNKFAWMKALRGADLSNAEYRVAANLWTWTDADLGNAYPGLTSLREAAQVSEPTVKKALKSLIAKGWVILVEPGGNQYFKGKANVYTLTVPEGLSDISAPEARGGRSVAPLNQPQGDHWLAPLAEPEGGNWDSQGGKSFPEGGKSDAREGGKQLAPHQVTTPDPHINGFHQGGGDVALGNARVRVNTAENRHREDDTQHSTGGPPHDDVRLGEVSPDPVAAPSPVGIIDKGSDREPVLMQPQNPLTWLDTELPRGFLAGERAQAQQMLDAGMHYTRVRWAILRDRQLPKRRHASRHRASVAPVESSGSGPGSSSPDSLGYENGEHG